MSDWNVYTDPEDGKQYFTWNGEVRLPPLYEKDSDQQGKPTLVIRMGDRVMPAYTIEDVVKMRDEAWDRVDPNAPTLSQLAQQKINAVNADLDRARRMQAEQVERDKEKLKKKVIEAERAKVKEVAAKPNPIQRMQNMLAMIQETEQAFGLPTRETDQDRRRRLAKLNDSYIGPPPPIGPNPFLQAIGPNPNPYSYGYTVVNDPRFAAGGPIIGQFPREIVNTWIDPSLQINVNTWIPGDGGSKSDPPPPSGRFQNLDFDEGEA